MSQPFAQSADVIKAISPSSFDVMRTCRLRTAFARSGQLVRAPPTAAQLLGDICHTVLESLADTRAILAVDWEAELESGWTTATHAAASRIGGPGGAPSGPPQDWDGYEIKLARLRKVARRLHELLAPVGADAELITEKLLSAADGRLRGQPDLIVRSDQVCWLLDYKTGPVLSHETRTPRESYVRQLRLYAYLAANTLGEWPDRTFLMPLQGEVVEVDIDPGQCTALAEEALEILASFNAANGEQPASPAPETCKWYPYAPRCSAFWDDCCPEWTPEVLAAMGTVEAVTRSRLGGVSVILRTEAGSLAREPIGVRSISVTTHPAVAEVELGDMLALVGLRRDRHADSFSLPPSGRIWAQRP